MAHKIPARYANYAQPLPLKPYAAEPAREPQRLSKPHEKGSAYRHTPSPSPSSAHKTQGPAAAATAAKKPGVSSSGGGSGSQQPSSTPHAPRQKKPVPIPVPHGATHLPSTHDLLKRHSTGQVKAGPPQRKGGGREKERGNKEKLERPRTGGEKSREEMAPIVVGARRRAWEERSGSPPHQPLVVKPFRRTVHLAPPEGVPLLDLSKLNEPDDKMDPIELLWVEDDSEQADLSWGIPCSDSMDTDRDKYEEKEEEKDEEEMREATEEKEKVESVILEEVEEASEQRSTHMKTTHAKFVEDKVLSHERAFSRVSPHPPTHPLPLSPAPHQHTAVTPAPQPKAGVALQSHVTLGMGVAETDLSKRLRFEARVLTQNGRDVHRELCGFFFLVDGSITVYEFRQFGKKSSALPLVQRRVYTHQTGHKRGQPYNINFIRKGATLHFPTSLLPSLPESMASRSLLSLRITHVSEREKRELICANRNPMERFSIESFLQHPLSPSEEKENGLLKTIQGAVRRQLVGHASKTLVGVGRHLTRASSLTGGGGGGRGGHSRGGRGGLVERAHLRKALSDYHIHLPDQDFSQLWCLLCQQGRGEGGGGGGGGGRREGGEGVGGGGKEEEGGMYVDRCIAGVAGEMNEERKAAVRKVFQKLDSHKSGTVSQNSVRRFYRYAPNSIEGVWFDHTHQSVLQPEMPSITYADFENYYEGVSIETAKDSDFLSLLKSSWTL